MRIKRPKCYLGIGRMDIRHVSLPLAAASSHVSVQLYIYNFSDLENFLRHLISYTTFPDLENYLRP